MSAIIARPAHPTEARIGSGPLRADGTEAHVTDAHVDAAHREWRRAVGDTHPHARKRGDGCERHGLQELDASGDALDDYGLLDDAMRVPARESRFPAASRGSR